MAPLNNKPIMTIIKNDPNINQSKSEIRIVDEGKNIF